MRPCAVWRLVLSALVTVAIATAIGCGDDDDGNGDGVGSCSVPAASTCTDYTGSMWTAASAEDNCKDIPSSSFSSSACPGEDMVGSCAHNQDGPGEFIIHYYGPTFTAQTAESACVSSGGVWIL